MFSLLRRIAVALERGADLADVQDRRAMARDVEILRREDEAAAYAAE